MSRRVAGRSKTSPRKGRVFGRQRVRLGWRKRMLRDIKLLGTRMRAAGVFDEAAIKAALMERQGERS